MEIVLKLIIATIGIIIVIWMITALIEINKNRKPETYQNLFTKYEAYMYFMEKAARNETRMDIEIRRALNEYYQNETKREGQ